jgi:hypothetical protein
MGISGYPVFPAPSDFEGDVFAKLGRKLRRGNKAPCQSWSPAVIVREGGRSSIPETVVIDREAAAYWIARSSRAMTASYFVAQEIYDSA